ncbi:hypothetical protein BA6E_101428 [Bacteroidales bacterium 6E]|nr:hypothetical protein BA6E_101428 [Bacteroidales bacterium 6E]
MKTMDEEFLYKKIQEALESIPENFNILEEQIDVELQIEYFEFARKFRDDDKVDYYLGLKDGLFDSLSDLDTRKKILVALASSSEVESFRAIEQYLKDPDKELKDWAVLALQESRMLMHSALLDEQQVFISTGLGGKGQKLRYFVVFLNKSGGELSEMQKKLLHDELKYAVDQNDGELEELSSMIDFTTATVIIPIKAPLKELFRGIIDECNQYGDFLKEDMVITNVKKLNPFEIVELLNQQRDAEAEGNSEDPEDLDESFDEEEDE